MRILWTLVGLLNMSWVILAIRGIRQRDDLIAELSADVSDLCAENAGLREELASTWRGQKRDRKNGRFA